MLVPLGVFRTHSNMLKSMGKKYLCLCLSHVIHGDIATTFIKNEIKTRNLEWNI